MHEMTHYHSLKDYTGDFLCLGLLNCIRHRILLILYISCDHLIKHAIRFKVDLPSRQSLFSGYEFMIIEADV